MELDSRLLQIFLFVAWLLLGVAATSEAKSTRKLVFDENGRFKIAQFADCKLLPNNNLVSLVIMSCNIIPPQYIMEKLRILCGDLNKTL